MRFRGTRASGGPVTAGGTYLVGERGPELLTMGASSGYITPNGAGSTINVTVTSADPNQVVAAIQKWTRDNGAVPMTTTTSIRR
jgi:phage-related minor tail protein